MAPWLLASDQAHARYFLTLHSLFFRIPELVHVIKK